MTSLVYLDDLSPGLKFTSGPLTISAADIKAFAGQFDPQPSISMKMRRRRASLAALPPVAGTRHPSACGCW